MVLGAAHQGRAANHHLGASAAALDRKLQHASGPGAGGGRGDELRRRSPSRRQALDARLVLSLLLRLCEGIGLPSGMAADTELGIPESALALSLMRAYDCR